MGFELEIIHWLQSFRNGLLDHFFVYATMFGEEVILILILGYIYWCHDKLIGEKIGITVFVSLAINNLLKLIVMRQRPFVVDSTITNLRPETSGGYSFPSGHAQTAATYSFGLFYVIKKRWLLIVAIIITTLVAVSRMYIGVHYLTDVLTGALIGIGIAFLVSKYYDKITYMKQIYLALLGLTLLAMVGILVYYYIQNTTNGVLDASAYYEQGSTIVKQLGTISGYVIAILYEKKYVQFENHRILYKNIIRFVLGVGIILLLRVGLKALFGLIVNPENLTDQGAQSILAISFDYLRYFIMLFVGIGLYTKLFKPFHF